MNVTEYVININIIIQKIFVNMFRNRNFKPLYCPPRDIYVDVSSSQFDDNGVQHISRASVHHASVDDKIPSPSDYTIEFAMKSGQLNPVNLDDFQISPTSDIVNDFISSTTSKTE